MHNKHTNANTDLIGKKNNIDTIKRIMSEKKTTVPSLWKSKRIIEKYPDKWHHRVKRYNIHRSTISLWKIWGPHEDHKKKVKTRVGTQTWITDKKTMTSSKNTGTEH